MPNRPYFSHVLVVPRLQVQNANAISSPLTHGFPAVSAFTGLMWALERKTQAEGLDIQFHGVGVVAHEFDEQVTDDPFVKAFRLTRNPLDKSGSTAAIVEEGRMHMTISLVFAIQSQNLDEDVRNQQIAEQIKLILQGMRIAGGSVLPSSTSRRNQPQILAISSDGSERITLFNKLKMHLLPGFTLVERQDLLDQRFEVMQKEDSEYSRLDAWLSLSRFNWYWQEDAENSEKREWINDRKGKGWLVPIPLGYAGISELLPAGDVANARDEKTDFRFVEAIYGIGQWVSPHRVQEVQQLLWFPEYQEDSAVYRCCNDFISTQTQEELEYDFD